MCVRLAAFAEVAVLTGVGSVSLSGLAIAEEYGAGIAKVIRGKTECRDTNENNAPCGVEHWTMYVHTNGQRYLHVISTSERFNETRHAMVRVGAQNHVKEAFMSNVNGSGILGSTYVVLQGLGAHVTATDSGFEGSSGEPKTEYIEAFDAADSIGTGPNSGDGLHFLDYDYAGPGEQPHSFYWAGGSRQGTVVGGFVTSEYTFLGKTKLTLADGQQVPANHFRMLSGTEIWLTDPDCGILRMSLKFGPGVGLEFETTELEITTSGL